MRVERRTAPAELRRRAPQSLWIGILGLVLGVGLGLLVARTLRSGVGSVPTRSLGAGIRQRLAAFRLRADLPKLELSMDFGAYLTFTGSGFGTGDGNIDSLCLPVQVASANETTTASVCPSEIAYLGHSVNNITATRPAFVLNGLENPELLVASGRALLMPAGADAVLARGYLSAVKDLGLPVPQYEVIMLSVNGSDWGFYTLEERWEIADRPGADTATGLLAVSYEVADPEPADGVLGSTFARSEATVGYLSGTELPDQLAAPVEAQDEAMTASSITPALEMLTEGGGTALQIFDAEEMGQVMALTALWRGCLVPDWRTLAFVYDPAAASFRPLVSGLPQSEAYALPSQLYDDPRVLRAYAKALFDNSDRAALDAVLSDSDLETLYLALGGASRDGLEEALVANQVRMRRVVAAERSVKAWQSDGGDVLSIELEVIAPFPVEVLGLEFGEEGHLELDPSWVSMPAGTDSVEADSSIVLPARTTAIPLTATLRIPRVALPLTAASDGTDLRLVTRLWGLDGSRLEPVQAQVPYVPAGTP